MPDPRVLPISNLIRTFKFTPFSLPHSLFPHLSGWKYDQNKFVGGLPGSIAPLGEFDPLEICYPEEMSESDVKRLREAEVMHGRVAMMAFVGYIIGEAVTPLTGKSFIMPTVVSGPANSHLAQVGGEGGLRPTSCDCS